MPAYRFTAGKVACINFLFQNRDSTFTVEISVGRRGPQITLKASNGKSHDIDLTKWGVKAVWGERDWYANVALILAYIFDRRVPGEVRHCEQYLAKRIPLGSSLGKPLVFDSTFFLKLRP